MSNRTRASWLVYVLGALSAGAVVAAILLVGPAPASQSTVTRTATAAQGVVQSTVSGSGNLEPATQLDLGFKTAGTIAHIYVNQGEHVTQGQLLASLDPQSAEVSLEEAKATLQSAEASLAREEETDGESSGSGGSGSSGASAAAASLTNARAAVREPQPGTTTPASTTPSTTTTPATTPTTTTPATTTPTTTTTPASPTPASEKSKKTRGSSGESSSGEATSGESKSGATSKTTLSTATREANIASARAAVKSDRLNVRSAEESLQDTNLYAPESGTIASLSGQVGEVVSGGGTTRAKSSSSSESSSATTGTTGRGAGDAASSSTGSASTGSSSTFAVLSDLSSMQLVVPLSESEVGNVHVGQIATVTVEALEGRKLAAHVSEISLLSTSNSGVVSYDVTFQLDQLTSGVRPGMSASAEVVVKQAEGVNVPTSAITADSVTVLKDGKRTTRRVVTGLAGNTSTIVLSGLSAGETVVLPSVSSTSSSSSTRSSLRSSLRGVTGAGGLAGAGGGAFPGGGGAAFFRGGG